MPSSQSLLLFFLSPTAAKIRMCDHRLPPTGLTSLTVGQTCQISWFQHGLPALTNVFCPVVAFSWQISMVSAQLPLSLIPWICYGIILCFNRDNKYSHFVQVDQCVVVGVTESIDSTSLGSHIPSKFQNSLGCCLQLRLQSYQLVSPIIYWRFKQTNKL